MTIKEYINLKEKLENDICKLILDYEQKCNVIINKINIKREVFINNDCEIYTDKLQIKIKDEFK